MGRIRVRRSAGVTAALTHDELRRLLVLAGAACAPEHERTAAVERLRQWAEACEALTAECLDTIEAMIAAGAFDDVCAFRRARKTDLPARRVRTAAVRRLDALGLVSLLPAATTGTGSTATVFFLRPLALVAFAVADMQRARKIEQQHRRQK